MSVYKYRLLCKNSLYSFIEESFLVLNPGVKFLPNWHLELISEYLHAVTKGEIKRLIINIPPRYMKSICISVCWTAWLLGMNPSRRILCASYSQGLALKHSVDTKHLINSKFFHTVFPNTILDDKVNNKTKFITSKRGFRFATSVGGTLTGEGGDFLILDDPHNAIQIHSSKYREKAINWFQQSFVSRLDNKKEGVIIIVMQRLHPHDLTGYLLENQKSIWSHLNIPAIADQAIKYYINNSSYFFAKGNILHPEREGKSEIENIRKELGCYAFNAQYLQSPIEINSGMVQLKWFQYYRTEPRRNEFDHLIQSWDTALKSGDSNSYSVCTIWGKLDSRIFLLDIVREKLEYPDLKALIMQKIEFWNPDHVLIEDKASGQSLLQDLKIDLPFVSFIAIHPTNDKITRFARVTPFFERHSIFLSESAEWRRQYEEELLSFPNSKTNDQVDSTSQYLNFIQSSNNYLPRIR